MIPDDELALPVAGTKELARRRWLAFAESCKLPTRVAERVLREIGAASDAAVELVEASALSEEMKRDYAALVRERSSLLLK